MDVFVVIFRIVFVAESFQTGHTFAAIYPDFTQIV